MVVIFINKSSFRAKNNAKILRIRSKNDDVIRHIFPTQKVTFVCMKHHICRVLRTSCLSYLDFFQDLILMVRDDNGEEYRMAYLQVN